MMDDVADLSQSDGSFFIVIIFSHQVSVRTALFVPSPMTASEL